MSALIEYILIAVLVFWLIRKIGGFLLKSWIGKVMRNQQEFSNNSGEEAKKREGEIFINKNKNTSDSNTDSIGEYVEYEEID